jgi:A/G-specific adenine glycosylase
LFDLGATICTPRRPACAICPWRERCQGFRQGIAASLPARAAKPARPRRVGAVYVLLDPADRVFLLRRPDRGLLGGMLGLPETPPIETAWQVAGRIEHVFTHFSLTLTVHLARAGSLPEGLAAPAATAQLPSVMRKALNAALAALDAAPFSRENFADAPNPRST